MDANDLSVLRSIVKFVRISKLLEVKVVHEINPNVVKAMQQFLASNEEFRNIWVVPMKNDDGLAIIRVQSGGNGPFSVATEQKLQKMAEIAKSYVSELFHDRVNVRRFTMPVTWNFWFIDQNVAHLKRVPPDCEYDPAVLKRRLKLPANQHLNTRSVLLSLADSKVSIVHGTADSGKRTEIVHHLLEIACMRKYSCRMLYVMEEEVEVIATAVRICEERNESIGTTVGYKLYINSQVGEMNNVVLSTIKTLMHSFLSHAFVGILNRLTHLIVDCGDRHPNEMSLLLTLVVTIQKSFAMKLVLLSSRNDEPSPFSEFFSSDTLVVRIPHGNPTVNYLPSQPHGVEYCYLDEILDTICTHEPISKMKEALPKTDNALMLMANIQCAYGHYSPNRNVTAIMDLLLERCWFDEDAELFTAVLLRFLEYNKHMVDYQHSDTRLTALMIASAKGFVDVIERLLTLGANPYIVGRKSLQAMNWCSKGSDNECWQMMHTAHRMYHDEAAKRSLLCQIYHKLYNPFLVDQKLVEQTVKHICSQYAPGNILVMLPDFADVLECYGLLRRSELGTRKTFVHFVVCNQFLTENELKENVLFSIRDRPELYVVILVTGPLLELVSSLLHIDYVVDTGLEVHRSGDYAKGICIDRSCLATAQRSRFLMWLAQRKCFMLYPKNYLRRVGESSKPTTKAAPNMARSEEVLKALVLRQHLPRAKRSNSALEFVCSTLFSTCSISIAASLETLKQIGAIEKPLSVPTSLGKLLFQLGVNVHLGKALLYSILFRCLDPMITIVAALKVGDPFIEPLDLKREEEIRYLKLTLHNRTYSDLMVLLRLYQQWTQCITSQTDQKMVQYHLKPGAMEAISNARVELMSLLRLLGIVKCGRDHNTEKLNFNASNWHMVKGCLAAGFYPQLVMAEFEKKLLTANCGTETFKPHPMSVAQVDQLPAKWVIYNRKQDHMLNVPNNAKHAHVQIIENTVISDVTLLLMCGIDRTDTLQTGNLQTRGCVDGKGPVEFIIDHKYLFQLPREIFDAVLFMRRRLGQLFKDFTLNMLKTMDQRETDELVAHIGDVLYAEDLSLMLTTTNFESRPKVRNLLPMGVFWNYTLDMIKLARK
ncbi:3'-5' RNA helicase YTHDC2-like [Anopheles marshallii]|uniref:3'-5' RNA helicase YTHDC2-like n=1 Tax=Anopheles marshallii TaxID=1521116 RepID=UPI00237B0500|nr:3'-5' RNA helicase YTHDC2-like [Anopheles marshallii]